MCSYRPRSVEDTQISTPTDTQISTPTRHFSEEGGGEQPRIPRGRRSSGESRGLFTVTVIVREVPMGRGQGTVSPVTSWKYVTMVGLSGFSGSSCSYN